MAESTMKEDLEELRGRISALQLICGLLINQFATTASLRSSIADALIGALDDLPESASPNVQARHGLSQTIMEVADNIIREDIA